MRPDTIPFPMMTELEQELAPPAGKGIELGLGPHQRPVTHRTPVRMYHIRRDELLDLCIGGTTLGQMTERRLRTIIRFERVRLEEWRRMIAMIEAVADRLDGRPGTVGTLISEAELAKIVETVDPLDE